VIYDALAAEDKARYELEKASYQGPAGSSSRKQKDPNAPKRPMSAYLAFANSRRGAVKGKNSECTNGEISKILSRMWKEADEDIKQKHREDEAVLWKTYKENIAEWRKKNDGRKKSRNLDDDDSSVPKKKRKSKKAKEGELAMSEATGYDQLDYLNVVQGGPVGMGNPNQEEMMAASALRGVRGGPNYPYGGNVGAPGAANDAQVGHAPMQAANVSVQHQIQYQQQGGGTGGQAYGSLFGMNGMNPFAVSGGGSGNGYSQDAQTSALLQMGGFPYQQYGGGFQMGNQQAMMMAQALRGGANPYQQQSSLSQLASFAGSQTGGNGNSQMSAQGMNNPNMANMLLPMGNMMNDNSGGSVDQQFP
jgi:hypothetical protein